MCMCACVRGGEVLIATSLFVKNKLLIGTLIQAETA